MKEILSKREFELLVCHLYSDKKLPSTKISKMLSCSVTSIFHTLNKHGIKSMQNGRHTYHHDRNYFEVIDTEHKAYILGFLYADGNINLSKYQIRLRLAIKDREILQKISDCLGISKPLKLYNQKLFGKIYPAYELSFYGKKMCEDLIKLGCVESKTSKLIFPKLDETLIHHFIRGYFDGDGCITIDSKRDRANVSICSTPEFNAEVLKFIRANSDVVGGEYNHKNIDNYSEIHICGNRQALELFQLLYKDSTIHLQRKYEKFRKVSKKE
jgi:intein-encoded DNA endonuclease-like protein